MTIASKVLTEKSDAPEEVAINTNLLEALREKNGFSRDQYGDLDLVLDEIRASIGNVIGAFSGEELEIQLSNVTMFTEVEHMSALASDPVFAGVDNDDEQLAIYLGMNGGVFRQLLGLLFGSSGNFQGSNDLNILSVSENKLFLRFARQICTALFQVLEINDPEHASPELQMADPKDMQGHALKLELISIIFDFTIAESDYQIAVVVPLALIQPAKSGQSDKQSAIQQRKEDEIWRQTLTKRISGVTIPLQAEISSLDMSLSDIAELEVDCRLETEFDMAEVKILDQEGNCAFLAEIDLSQQNTMLKVWTPRVEELKQQNGA